MGQASAFLWAYAFDDGSARALTDQDLAGAPDAPEVWIWTHFPLSDQRSRLHLENLNEVPAAARRGG